MAASVVLWTFLYFASRVLLPFSRTYGKWDRERQYKARGLVPSSVFLGAVYKYNIYIYIYIHICIHMEAIFGAFVCVCVCMCVVWCGVRACVRACGVRVSCFSQTDRLCVCEAFCLTLFPPSLFSPQFAA